MAKRSIHTLKQLHNALRSITLQEFMQLSRPGRAAYGALFDELEQEYDEEAPPSLPPAAQEPKRFKPPPPVNNQSLFPQQSMAPPGAWFKMQPLSDSQEIKPWARALAIMGVEEGVAVGVLEGTRELWACDGSLRTMRDVGFVFDQMAGAEKFANVGTDVYVS